MKARFFFLLTICNLFFLYGQSQRIIEFGIKPTEFLLRNFEVYGGIGNKKVRFGLFLSYRPSTQDSGEVKGMGTGAASGYSKPHLNKLYNSYTVGLYQRIYLNKKLDFFVETDEFYRNWNFKNKRVKLNHTEKGYQFDGIRTENIDVYGLKLLLGGTTILTPKEDKVRLYVDIYIGAGVRLQNKTYETYDGFVEDVYHDYFKEIEHPTMWSVQGGIKFGIMIGR